MNPEFYLDNAATTALLPEALEEARPLLEESFGNPSSLHSMGMDAGRAIKRARERLAVELGVPPQAIVFTSGGTESDNLALRGLFPRGRDRKGRLLLSVIEHPAVIETAAALEREGVRVERIPVTRAGVVDLARLETMLDGRDVGALSCMAVNNELGTLQPLETIGRLLKSRFPKAVFHVDAVQAFSKMQVPWQQARVDLLSLSAHKIHGPKGMGALVRCRPVPLDPLLEGGGQEAGLRSGTENPFAIVAFASAAAHAAARHGEQSGERAVYHRSWLEKLAEYPLVRVFRSERETPFIISFHCAPIPGEVVLHHLESEGLLVSTGSACSTRKAEPSPVLLAAGLTEPEALSSVRLSFSLNNTLDGLKQVFPAFQRAMQKLARV